MGLESVVAGALAAAREAGIVEPAEPEGDGVDPVEETDEPTVNDEGTEDADGDKDKKPAKATVDADKDEDDVDAKGEKKPKAKVETDEDEDADAEATAQAAKDKKAADDKAAADKKKAEEDENAEIGPERDAKGKINKIPHPQVQKIVKNAEGKLIKSVVDSLGFDPAKVTAETLPKALKSVVSHIKGLQNRVAVMDELGPIMEKDAKAFISRLAENWPDIYNPVLEAMEGKGATTVEPSAATANLGEEPGPDVEITLPDGSKGRTFSVEGMKKRDVWRDAHLTSKILDDVEKRLGKRFEPLDKAKKATDDAAIARAEVARDMNDILEDAQTWDGFKENEAAIFEEWKTMDPAIPMRKAINAAYQKIVVVKYKQSALDARQKVLDELAAAPDGTSSTSRTQRREKDVVRGEGGEIVTGTEAIVRRALARARASGKV